MKEFYKKRIWMTEEEIQAIEDTLSPTDVMLEWGSGGSTLYFPYFVKKYFSIEHDASFAQTISPIVEYRDNIKYLVVPNNLPRSTITKKEEFLDYIKAVRSLDTKFNKVLIDGRARQWCGIEVLPYLEDNALVFIHDWVRERYHILLEYYTIHSEIKSESFDANGLAILRKK